jgi:putative effector of murein hydrolase
MTTNQALGYAFSKPWLTPVLLSLMIFGFFLFCFAIWYRNYVLKQHYKRFKALPQHKKGDNNEKDRN